MLTVAVSRFLAAAGFKLLEPGENSKYSPRIVSYWQMVPCHAAQVVPKKESPGGVLHAPRHFHHILHDLLDRCVRNGHVDGPDGHH